MTTLDDCHIRTALEVAVLSPCRSKRGVALFDPMTGAHRGAGHNGPPASRPCPGRQICAGTCGQRSVHAEMRALREAEVYTRYHGAGPWDLVHVELADPRMPAHEGAVYACDGPSCMPCASLILDVGFIGGVWLYEMVSTSPGPGPPSSVVQLHMGSALMPGRGVQFPLSDEWRGVVRQRLKAKKWNMADLARAIGVTRSTVSSLLGTMTGAARQSSHRQRVNDVLGIADGQVATADRPIRDAGHERDATGSATEVGLSELDVMRTIAMLDGDARDRVIDWAIARYRKERS